MPTLFEFNWIFGIIGTIGIAGTIVLMIFAPTAFTALYTIVKDILSTRVGLAVAIALAAGYGGLVYGDVSGRSEERVIAKADQLRADQEAAQRDKDAADAAAEDAKKRIADLEAQHATDEEKLNAFAQQVPKDDNCVVTPGDADRLQSFFGGQASPVKTGNKPAARPVLPRPRPTPKNKRGG